MEDAAVVNDDLEQNNGEQTDLEPPKRRKCKLWVKITCIVLAVIIGIIAIFGIVFACVWSDEISTVRSFTKVRSRNDANDEGSVYSMNVKGGFYFDDFLLHSRRRAA